MKPKKISNIWIIKPGESSNRGNGISVSDDLIVIKHMINTKELHNNGKPKTYIL